MGTNYPDEKTTKTLLGENKVVVDSLPCGFKKPMWIFGVTLFFQLINFIISFFYIFFGFIFFIGYGGHIGINEIILFLGQFSLSIGIEYVTGLGASGFTFWLLYLFAKGTKTLTPRVYSATTTLMFFYLVNLVLGLIWLFTDSSFFKLSLIYVSTAIDIAIFINYYLMGSWLCKTYEGAISHLGDKILWFIYFVVTAMILILVSVVLLEINSLSEVNRAQDEGSTAGMIGGFVLITAGLWCIFVFFYLIFGIYYKMAKILQNGVVKS